MNHTRVPGNVHVKGNAKIDGEMIIGDNFVVSEELFKAILERLDTLEKNASTSRDS